jgi:transposase
VIADGRGRAITFALAPGQAHELPMAPSLLDCLPDVPDWIVGDRGFASDAFRERIWDMGARPAIPPRRTDAPVACRAWIYNNRHLVENLWARLKEWRAVATRYEKTARSFLGILCPAATADWLRLRMPHTRGRRAGRPRRWIAKRGRAPAREGPDAPGRTLPLKPSFES